MKTYYAVQRNNRHYSIFESIPELVDYIFPMLDDYEKGKYWIIKFYKKYNQSPTPEDYTPTNFRTVDLASLEPIYILHDHINVISCSPPSDTELWQEIIDSYGFVDSVIPTIELYDDPSMF